MHADGRPSLLPCPPLSPPGRARVGQRQQPQSAAALPGPLQPAAGARKRECVQGYSATASSKAFDALSNSPWHGGCLELMISRRGSASAPRVYRSVHVGLPHSCYSNRFKPCAMLSTTSSLRSLAVRQMSEPPWLTLQAEPGVLNETVLQVQAWFGLPHPRHGMGWGMLLALLAGRCSAPPPVAANARHGATAAILQQPHSCHSHSKFAVHRRRWTTLWSWLSRAASS